MLTFSIIPLQWNVAIAEVHVKENNNIGISYNEIIKLYVMAADDLATQRAMLLTKTSQNIPASSPELLTPIGNTI